MTTPDNQLGAEVRLAVAIERFSGQIENLQEDIKAINDLRSFDNKIERVIAQIEVRLDNITERLDRELGEVKKDIKDIKERPVPRSASVSSADLPVIQKNTEMQMLLQRFEAMETARADKEKRELEAKAEEDKRNAANRKYVIGLVAGLITTILTSITAIVMAIIQGGGGG